jgi:hypothetical protein
MKSILKNRERAIMDWQPAIGKWATWQAPRPLGAPECLRHPLQRSWHKAQQQNISFTGDTNTSSTGGTACMRDRGH